MKKITRDELEKLNKEQIGLSKKIIYESFEKEVRNVCAVDVSYWEIDGKEYSGCVAIVYDIKKKEIIEKASLCEVCNFPYISGYLSYRESDIELRTINKLHTKFDLLMVDGNGVLHERKAGEAVVLGIKLNIATIGVAKTYCNINNKDYSEPGNMKGNVTDIIVNDEIIGKVVRTKSNTRPVFVSVGNKILLEDCVYWTLKLSNNESYIPYPLKLVDIETHKLRDKQKGLKK